MMTGVSPRITAALWGMRTSEIPVSRICQERDPVVAAWRTRSLVETRYPGLRGDGWRPKMRAGAGSSDERPLRDDSEYCGVPQDAGAGDGAL
jgi:transposase-like protein